MADDAKIVRNDQASRFELADEPETAHLLYRREGQRLTLTHTEVDDRYEGRGVGSALVREALDYAQREQLTVVPVCRFVAGWLDRHPERAGELDIAAP